MAVTAGDILSLSCRHVWNDVDDQVNKLHVRIGTAPTPNDDPSLAEDLVGWVSQMYQEIEGLVANVVGAIDITLYNVTDDRPLGQYAWDPGYTGGQGTGESLPTQVTCLLLLRTGLKRRLGRIYFPTFTEAHSVAGRWGASALAIPSLLDPYLLGSTTGGNGTVFVPVVYSPTDGLGYSITGTRIMPIPATLSTRKIGRGS